MNNRDMGHSHGPKKGGKSRHTRPRVLREDFEEELFFVDKRPADDGSSTEKTAKNSSDDSFIPLKVPSGGSGNNGSDSSNSDSNSDSGAEQDYIDNILANSDAEEDVVFANLVKEYRFLMSPGTQNDIEWTLDENAERILRDRKSNDPKYTNMKQEDFDDIISFEGIYGKKQRAGLQARLRKLSSQDDDYNKPGPSHGEGRRKGKNNREPEFELNFKQLNREIKEFVRSEEAGEEFELEPHPPIVRKMVHELAHMYGLRSKSNGQGAERHCVLVKCENTRLPRDLKRLDKFLEGAQKAVRYSGGRPSKERYAIKTKITPSTAAARVTPGTVIGSEAAPIDDDNVGNKMLRKLGWSPGQGLGSEKAGRTEPVEAVFRGNRTGLGH